MLACAGLGDDASFAHAHGEQCLAEDVVDLVRARVIEVLALEQDPRAAAVLGESASVCDRARASDVGALKSVELVDVLGIDDRGAEGRVELVERRGESLGHETTAVGAEVARRVRTERVDGRQAGDALRRRHESSSLSRACA